MSVNQDKLINLLKEKGLKVTSQRIGVLETLAAFPDEHLTAEEIYGKVKLQYPEIGLATVYRNVQLLLELHLIEKITLDDGCVRYEIAKQKDGKSGHHHHHLVCISCGNVFSFQDDLLEELENRIQEKKGFQVTDHEVKFYGYCRDCATSRK
ncbi:MAG: transcriptional repressor [Lachnospiraceae bacterium]|nr:transcriptional repressor [Lachnospiraceae bacterium]